MVEGQRDTLVLPPTPSETPTQGKTDLGGKAIYRLFELAQEMGFETGKPFVAPFVYGFFLKATIDGAFERLTQRSDVDQLWLRKAKLVAGLYIFSDATFTQIGKKLGYSSKQTAAPTFKNLISWLHAASSEEIQSEYPLKGLLKQNNKQGWRLDDRSLLSPRSNGLENKQEADATNKKDAVDLQNVTRNFVATHPLLFKPLSPLARELGFHFQSGKNRYFAQVLRSRRIPYYEFRFPSKNSKGRPTVETARYVAVEHIPLVQTAFADDTGLERFKRRKYYRQVGGPEIVPPRRKDLSDRSIYLAVGREIWWLGISKERLFQNSPVPLFANKEGPGMLVHVDDYHKLLAFCQKPANRRRIAR